MTSHTRLDAETAEWLSRMCADLDDLGELPDPRYAHALERLRRGGQPERLRGGGRPERPDCGESERLRRGESADVDVRAALAELEEVLRAYGVAGAGSVGRGAAPFRPLPGVGAGAGLEEVYVCPRDLCARVEIPGPTGPPRCAVSATPLPLFRLDR